MARRLSTVYYFMELDIVETQIEEMISLFKKNNFFVEVKVFENGDKDFTLSDESTEIPLTFKSVGSSLKLEGVCTITNWNLAYVMQKILRHFKGNALVHRNYEQFTIEYLYCLGKVTHIMEYEAETSRVIYKHETSEGQQYDSFNERVIEDKIAWIYLQIDQLLDRRLNADTLLKGEIDIELSKLCHELFLLEG